MTSAAEPLTIARLVAQLHALGVPPGGVLLVHTAYTRVRPVEGGPAGLIAALRAALGPAGTLVMPSMTDDDLRPFDRHATPCRGMGVVADTFWRLPGVSRSDSPHAFAAVGPHAARITADHPLEVPHGPDSPPGRVADLDGWVLLLGVTHHASTTAHLAEEIAGVPYRVPVWSTVWRDGRAVRRDYREPDHCCARFEQLDDWLIADGRLSIGPVGHGIGRLMRSRDVVAAATRRLAADPTVFLHPPGTDADCDAAWRSMD